MTQRAFPEADQPVLVVGVGLIGGSVALGLRRAGMQELWGADLAPGLQLVDEPALFSRVVAVDSAGFSQAIADARLIVLAAPLPAIEALLPQFASASAVVTDCGSAKRRVCELAEALKMRQFVGGHPMAGKERGGFEHAAAGLFQGRSWFLCPTPLTEPAAVECAEQLALRLGARPQIVAAGEHDRGVALTSHVSQLVASVMVKLAGEDRRRFAGPGFEDATRVGGGPEAMWSGVLSRNAEEVAAALAELEQELGELRAGLERGDIAPALEVLAEARRLKRW